MEKMNIILCLYNYIFVVLLFNCIFFGFYGIVVCICCKLMFVEIILSWKFSMVIVNVE